MANRHDESALGRMTNDRNKKIRIAENSPPPRVLPARVLAATLAMACALASSPVYAQSASSPAPPVEDIAPAAIALDPDRGDGVYPVYASADLRVGSPAARQALVIIHGRLRNAADYFATGLALVKKAGDAGSATVVVAPQLLLPADVTAHRLDDRYLRWVSGWESGVPAQGPSPASSYDVLDDVVAKLSNASAFPQLTRIVFVGHGGGAQLLARYAVVTKLQSSLTISFVIANAGTYLYPTTARPLPPACPDFNAWKYGMSDPPPYVGDPDRVLKDFAARNITLLLGSDDRKADGVLDQSCAAKAQGRNRFERGLNFVRTLAASGMAPLLKHAIVHDVGHNERKMLFSTEASDAIFATGAAAR
jgi:hypothetical protein